MRVGRSCLRSAGSRKSLADAVNVTGLANSSQGVSKLVGCAHAIGMKLERIVSVFRSAAVLAGGAALATQVCSQGWVNIATQQPGPGAGDVRRMVYDPVQQDLVLIRADQVFRYDGQDWSGPFTLPPLTTLSGNQGPISSSSDAVWDAVNGQIRFCCYSAFQNYAAYVGWDGQSLTVLGNLPGGTSSGAVADVQLVYDQHLDRVVSIESLPGNSPTTTYLRKARVWDDANGNWQQVVSGFPPLFGLGNYSNGYHLFYDASESRVAVIGGARSSVNDPWIPFYYELDGMQWVQHYPAFPSGFGDGEYDFWNTRVCEMPTLGESWLFDMQPGQTQANLWSMAGRQVSTRFLTSWPSQRRRMAMGYDPIRDRVVLHGGNLQWAGSLNDTWELDPGPSATYSTYGSGCGSGAIIPSVAAQNGTLPSVNTQFSVQVSGLPFTAPSFMWVGFSNQSYSGYPLPLDLGFLGAPGCEVLITPDLLYPIPNILGTGVWTLGIPNVPGTVFYNQTVSLDASANSLGLIFSNAGEAVVGQ